MKAGRELDALVAEKVMGIDVQYTAVGHPYFGDGILLRKPVLHYSTDIAAAWLVVDHMNSIKMDTPEGYQLRAKWSYWIHGASLYNCTAEQAAKEICLCACRAMDVSL